MNDTASTLALARVERHALERLGRAQELRNHMPRFMRWAWPIDPSHPKALIWNWHIDAICDHLMACRTGEIRRLIVNVPPRTLKSWSVSVAFPAWVWASDPSVQFLCTSADKDVVLRDADMQRDLCLSKPYREMFRPKWNFRAAPDTAQQAAKGYYRNSFGGHRISKPMGTKGTGHNADVVIFDDPLDPADAFSDKAGLAQHVINARQRFMSRFNDPDTGVAILIMQRLHELDLSGVFLGDGGWTHLCLPAEYDGNTYQTWSGWSDPRTEVGELLFPARLHRKLLDERLVDLTARGYAGQYQQAPAPAAGAIVLKKYLEYWIPSTLPDMTYTIGSWDCTFGSTTADADFVVGQTWGVAGENAYLLDQVRRKMTFPQMLEAVREQDRLWPGLRAIVVEEKAAGKDVIDTLEREIYGIDPYKPKSTSKEERLIAGLPMWEQHHVYLPHPVHASDPVTDYSWVREFYVPELLTFPGATHDDQVDATSQALIWIMANGSGEGCGIEVLG